MKTALQAQMSQQMGMTPQLLQSIRLLHLNAIEVEQEVARALEENPLLEREDGAADGDDDGIVGESEGNEAEEVLADDAQAAEDFDDFVAGEFSSAGPSGDSDPFENVRSAGTGGIRGAIRAQLALELDDPRTFAVACWILDHIGDAGYLEMPRAQLLAQAAREFGIDEIAVETLRQRILHCEPAGFGASDLRECLLAQLSELPADSIGVTLAARLLNEQIDLLARQDRAALVTALGAGADEIDAAIAVILSLDPKPGTTYSAHEADVAIVPDVIVRRRSNGWHVALSARAAPRVRVDAQTERLLAQSEDSASTKYLRDMLQEARWLARGLSMRYETLLRTTRAIVERQAEFLDKGEEHMRPLILREIAAAIGMHESSISRITTGKYMQTPRGTFELKYFFSAPLDGAAVAGVAVRAMVKRMIETENRAAPLADDTIVALLARRGIRIARRTVAKYRDILHIASAKERAGANGLAAAGF